MELTASALAEQERAVAGMRMCAGMVLAAEIVFWTLAVIG
jgi:hypothetical protein